MLEGFPTETRVVRVQHQPVQLDGFYSENELRVRPPDAQQRETPRREARKPEAPRTDLRRPEVPAPEASRPEAHHLAGARAITKPRIAAALTVVLALVIVAAWRLTPVATFKQTNQRPVTIALRDEPAAFSERRPEIPATPVPTEQPTPVPTEQPKPEQPKIEATPSQSAERVGTSSLPKSAGKATTADLPVRLPIRITSAPAAVDVPRARQPVTVANATAATLRADLPPVLTPSSPAVVPKPEPLPLPAEPVANQPNALAARTDVIAGPAVVPSRPTAVASSANIAIVNETAAIQDVIRRYEQAYENLDASAAKQIWPSLDERALARAFSGLAAQTLRMQPCEIDVASGSAIASCRGYATYVGRVGPKSGQTQQRDWKFYLRKSAEGWRIGSVQSN
jgi:hypothetical protein